MSKGRLRSRLEAETGGLPSLPHSSRVNFKREEEDILREYCPILGGKCGVMECRDCSLISFIKNPNEIQWLCSSCTSRGEAHPFWTSGSCDSCGVYSSVLILT